MGRERLCKDKHASYLWSYGLNSAPLSPGHREQGPGVTGSGVAWRLLRRDTGAPTKSSHLRAREKSPHQEPDLLAAGPGFQPPKRREINVCCLHHMGCSALLMATHEDYDLRAET